MGKAAQLLLLTSQALGLIERESVSAAGLRFQPFFLVYWFLEALHLRAVAAQVKNPMV